MSSDIDTPGPTVAELRVAGVDAHVAWLRAELDALFEGTRRGRLALRVSRWYARRRP